MRKELIVAFRKTHLLKQEEMAEKLGIAQSYLSLLESGKKPINKRVKNRLNHLIEIEGINYDLIKQRKHNITDKMKLNRIRENQAVGEEVASVVAGVSPDAPTIFNEHGAAQSDSPYLITQIPPMVLLKIAEKLKIGADKYGKDNWKGISIDDHINHMMVHILAYMAGDTTDEHLVNAACRVIFALGVDMDEAK